MQTQPAIAGPENAMLFRTHFKAMGSACEIAVAAASADGARKAMEGAAREVNRIERKYSRYRTDDDSIIHRINRAAGGAAAIPCDPETVRLLSFCAHLHRISGGLFDITSGVLRRAWNFKSKTLPAPGEIAPLLPLVGFDMVELADSSIRLPRHGMEIDFGGIGKEYAADRAAALLKTHGVTSGYVNLGGDIYALGHMPDGRPWRFGVVDPRNSQAVIANIPISDGALVTSGDYEKFIQVDGIYYSHILHPKTGMSVKCWRSVSVAGVSALTAGALATIAMLKEAEAEEFLKTMPCRYLLVDGSGRLITNERRRKSE